MNLLKICSDTLIDGPYAVDQNPDHQYLFTVQCATEADKQRLDAVLFRKVPAICKVDVVVKQL